MQRHVRLRSWPWLSKSHWGGAILKMASPRFHSTLLSPSDLDSPSRLLNDSRWRGPRHRWCINILLHYTCKCQLYRQGVQSWPAKSPRWEIFSNFTSHTNILVGPVMYVLRQLRYALIKEIRDYLGIFPKGRTPPLA